MGDAAGRRDRAAHPHQGLELPLAGRVHVRAASGAAEGHRHRDAIHVRQLRGESPAIRTARRGVSRSARPARPRWVRCGCRSCRAGRPISRGSSRTSAPKILRDDIAGNEKWLEVEPRNAQLRAELAACYLEANRLDDALRQLNEAVRLDPTRRPPLRRGTRAADPAELRRRRKRIPKGARAEARVR